MTTSNQRWNNFFYINIKIYNFEQRRNNVIFDVKLHNAEQGWSNVVNITILIKLKNRPRVKSNKIFLSFK